MEDQGSVAVDSIPPFLLLLHLPLPPGCVCLQAGVPFHTVITLPDVTASNAYT